jgi:TolB-like protein/class 3 adenylate cyclase/Flp pilus assembly protein TadD
MAETRKLAAILAADVVGFSRLAGADEDRTLARLRALRSDLIDPTIAVHHGRVVKRTGDGALVEFRSVVDAVRCAVEIQSEMVERNAGLTPERRIDFRIGIHLGDVVEESDGDLMGDGVNIAARLEGIAKPGAICLSEDAYRQVKARLDLTLSDLGPTQLKNIAELVRVYSLEVGGPAQRKSPEQAKPSSDSFPPRLSIVVLPFANLGGDPEQEYFVDGVTENLTTDLSRISGSFVIARNTAFTYKGKPHDVKQIGRELNVRYALEGSIQRSGSRMRVNVQLIDAVGGAHLWADRFDKPVADLFDMQDEIIARLAAELDTQLVVAEARRAEQAPSPDSMDLYFQGRACLHKGLAPKYAAQAVGFFERALALEPDNVDALATKAWLEATVANSLITTDRAARLKAAEAVVTKALCLAPNHPSAHATLGLIYNFSNRAAQGIAECDHALALDRNLATAHAYVGFGKLALGRAEETDSHILEALRLSPRDVMAWYWMFMACAAKLQLGSDEEAAAWARRSIDANRNIAMPHFYLAVALVHLGRLEEARAAVQAGLAIDPTFTIRRWRSINAMSDNPTFLAQRERIPDGMHKAGVPGG